MKRRKVEEDEETPKKKPRPPVDELPLLVARHPTTGKLIEIDYSTDVEIHDLEKDARQHSARFAWYLSLRDEAADVLRDAQAAEYQTEEDLYLEYKESVPEKTTETALKTMVKANTKMREAYAARSQAESRLKRVQSVVDAMTERRWSLQMLVKLKTAEMGSGLGDA